VVLEQKYENTLTLLIAQNRLSSLPLYDRHKSGVFRRHFDFLAVGLLSAARSQRINQTHRLQTYISPLEGFNRPFGRSEYDDRTSLLLKFASSQTVLVDDPITAIDQPA